MPTQPATPEFPLSTQLARVKVPQYLFPPGIIIAELSGSEPLFPLVIDHDKIKPEVMGQPEFVAKHSEVSIKYLEANYPEFKQLPDDERKKVAYDYSYHFIIELLVYQALAHGSKESNVQFEFKKTLEDITEQLTFPNFLTDRLSENLKKGHPMYARMSKEDADTAVSVRPIIDDDGNDSLLISIDDPTSMYNQIRNDNIGKMMREKLSGSDVSSLLDIYLHNDKQKDFIRSLPLLI